MLADEINSRMETLIAGLSKPEGRFVKDILSGIAASRSLWLTRIAESLAEPIPLHASHKRLSRNLGKPRIGAHVVDRILCETATQVSGNTQIILDYTHITKKFATKMQYIDDITTGDESVQGYRVCEALVSDADSAKYQPISFTLWSRHAPDAPSDQDQFCELIDQVQRATDARGTLVLNAAIGDNDQVLSHLMADNRSKFIVRLRASRELIHDRQANSCRELGSVCPLPYSAFCFKYTKNREKQYCLQYGFIPVRLPMFPNRKLSLVIAKCDSYDALDREPMYYYLLTSEPMRRNRKLIMSVVEAYTKRINVVEGNRQVHEKVKLDDLRVLTYDRVKTLYALYLATHHVFRQDVYGSPLGEIGFTFERKCARPPTIRKVATRPRADHGLSFPSALSRERPQFTDRRGS